MAADRSPKRRNLTDFFVKLPTDTPEKPQEIPELLGWYQPTEMPRRPARPKRSFGCPRKTAAPMPDTSDNLHEPCPDSSHATPTTRGVYRSYSLEQKLEVDTRSPTSTSSRVRQYMAPTRSGRRGNHEF